MSRECTSITVAHCFQEPRIDCHARDSCRLPLVHPYVGLLIRALTPQCRSLRAFPRARPRAARLPSSSTSSHYGAAPPSSVARGRPLQRHRSHTRSRRNASGSTPSAVINTERRIHASSTRRLSTVRTRDRKLDPTSRQRNHLPSAVHAESVQSSYSSSSTSALAAVRKACPRTVQAALPTIPAVPIAL